jgi:hypothetical protein
MFIFMIQTIKNWLNISHKRISSGGLFPTMILPWYENYIRIVLTSCS